MYVDKVVNNEVETIKQVPVTVEKLVSRNKVTLNVNIIIMTFVSIFL